MKPKPPLKIGPTLWIFIITPIVVACFIAANFVVSYEARRIREYGASIATNAAPSIERLVTARSVVQDLEISVGVSFSRAAQGQAIDRSFFVEDDAKLHEQLHSYLEMPFYPGEHALYAAIDGRTDEFERAADRVLTLLESGDRTDARTLMRTVLHPAADAASSAIKEAIDFNTGQITKTSVRIVQLQHRVLVLSYALNAAAALVSIFMMLLAARAVRAYQIVEEAHRRTAEGRAAELENFAGQVAHDLKHPLGSMLLRVGLAERKSGDETYGILGKQIASLGKLIDGLLEFAVAGARVQPATAANLRDVLQDLLPSLDPEVRAIGAELSVEGVLPFRVACAPSALYSILSNLLLNALKYLGDASQPRRVTVRAESCGGRVRFEVEDTGPGIPPGKEQAIFQPFVRLEGTAAQPGFGLGLATVKRIVEAYGGRVGVRSGITGGACFWVELDESAPQPRPSSRPTA